MKEIILSESTIKDKIFTIRGVQVMLDRDLANLYDVEIRRLNEQVKRNEERFPDNFMFQLTPEEYKWMVSQNAIPSKDPLRSQNATLENNRGKHRKYLPYVFTEQGISMLSGVLRSKTAIQVSIKIINAFVAMRKFISKNAEIFYRIDNVERKQLEFELKTEQNFEKVFNAMQNEKPKQGIFYDGQVFEAYKFVCELVRTAKKEILLIDNYIDESILILFSKREKDTSVTIYTQNISKQLKLDLEKFNSQYEPIILKELKKSHDRFLLIDGEIYHIGASLKDLGKKWFAFSKIEKDSFELIKRLKDLEKV